MNLEQPKATLPVAIDIILEYDVELMRIHHLAKRTYRDLMVDDGVGSKVMRLLEIYA